MSNPTVLPKVSMNGESASVKVNTSDVITKRAKGLNQVDLRLISKDIAASTKLDYIVALKSLASVCADKSCIDPEWGLLAGRLLMETIHFIAPKSFLESTFKLKQILSPPYYDFVVRNAEYLQSILSPQNDFSFDYFAVSTLLKSYLCHLKTSKENVLMETPQYMYMRVAVYIHYPDLVKIAQAYGNMKFGNYSHASPTMFNAGLKKPQLSSCFLQYVADDTSLIADAVKHQMIISKNSGGLGVDWSAIRHSEIGQHGFSNGVVPWLKITDAALKAVDQGGKRKGSGTMYLRDCHVDIYEFVELQDEGPDEIRTRDLFLGLMVSDLFMTRVEANGVWSLFCPNKVPGLFDKWGIDFEMEYTIAESEGLFIRQVRARDLWQHILNMQIKRGMPFILYMDACNRKSNQKHSGVIRSSNLCVSGDTMVLTDRGEIQIREYENKEVNVWNGEQFSRVTIQKTGTGKDLVRVVLENGIYLDCTPEHHFYSYNHFGYKVCAGDLQPGDQLLTWSLPHTTGKIRHVIKCVKPGPRNTDTFCFTEPKRHMGVFNGILTGQCTEILEVTDKDQIASCTLASICLNNCVDYTEDNKPFFNFDKLSILTAELVRNLNNVIDRNFYPAEVPQIKYSNMLHRPLGIGVQGLADAFALLDIAWVDDRMDTLSKEAEDLNLKIFECMYYSAVKESIELAKVHGPYETFRGSPASNGMFQFDLWESERVEKELKKTEYEGDKLVEALTSIPRKKKHRLYSMDQWDALRKEMVTHGMRNSLLIALMPTASSAHILGNIECFEPLAAAIYTRTVLSGQFVIVNKHIVRDLREIGLWNTSTVQEIFRNEGSIQGVKGGWLDNPTLDARLEFIKRKYLTVNELPQRPLLTLAADRGEYICQTASQNCFMPVPSKTKLNAYHFYGWKLGLKTGMYYLRQKAAASGINMSLGSVVIPEKDGAREKEECLLCQA